MSELTDLFETLAKIPSPSMHEDAVAEKIVSLLNGYGVSARRDAFGNVRAEIPATDETKEPLLLSAHMDAVTPACGKKPVLHPDGRITSDGTTVLGADDISGLCVILEAVTSVLEDGAPHRPVELLFDAAEESYCTGIQQFDFSRLRSKTAYVFDLSGPVGSAAYQAPSIVSFRAEFTGRAAHAAFSPEEGLHAIKAAAEAAAHIDCGRVGDLTVNIGTITGGTADNIVPETCALTGEARGFDHPLVLRKLAEIEQTIRQAASRFGCAVRFTTETLCQAFRADPEGQAAQRFRAACASVGLESSLTVTYGGSDNNHFCLHGLTGLVVAPGMNSCHSCQEYTSADELTRAARIAEALIVSRK